MARPRKIEEQVSEVVDVIDEQNSTDTVQMKRSPDYNGPHLANVHKDEVQNWLKANKGWEIV